MCIQAAEPQVLLQWALVSCVFILILVSTLVYDTAYLYTCTEGEWLIYLKHEPSRHQNTKVFSCGGVSVHSYSDVLNLTYSHVWYMKITILSPCSPRQSNIWTDLGGRRREVVGGKSAHTCGRHTPVLCGRTLTCADVRAWMWYLKLTDHQFQILTINKGNGKVPHAVQTGVKGEVHCITWYPGPTAYRNRVTTVPWPSSDTTDLVPLTSKQNKTRWA